MISRTNFDALLPPVIRNNPREIVQLHDAIDKFNLDTLIQNEKDKKIIPKKIISKPDQRSLPPFGIEWFPDQFQFEINKQKIRQDLSKTSINDTDSETEKKGRKGRDVVGYPFQCPHHPLPHPVTELPCLGFDGFVEKVK